MKENFSGPVRRVALAILYQQGKFLMQLRDDLPHILYPGKWGFFGGHLEAGENPTDGLKRELLEEIGYEVVAPQLFRCYTGDQIIRYIYSAPLTVSVNQLVQAEGQDLALVTADAVRSGCYYSHKINQVRSLGEIHQRILLDFMEAEAKLNP
ncbi:NUDIX hydrolase [Gloeothece verrucosa]|uniref:NUDIX hydrolase n=1 Tax=Gloeothece verrucosa (strain PCC 7822) TaxID=497965 RepID=E0U8H0_GLOV7|nr:NUDIX hydrolase [Gloeothece verrucosa]ADN13716.1 NUDIX hydrolase [Gloeothece verrucosa PCC 7822]